MNNRSNHYHFLLLCLFFVFHGFNENYPYVTPAVAGILLLNEVIAAVIIFLISLVLFRSAAKASLFVFIVLSVNFFFGAFHDALKSIPSLKSLSTYHILLPLIAIILIVSFILLRRTKYTLSRLNKYLMVLMLVFVGLEVFSLLKHFVYSNKDDHSSAQQLSTQKTAADPDIYFILFDSYAGNQSLNKVCHFDNSPTENILRTKGFYVPSYSSSNYNSTAFSLASTLNMKYLTGIRDVNACDVEDYARCAEEIKNNTVTSFLQSRGYEIVNHSVFDLKGHPSPVNETYLPLGTRLISDQTLLNRLHRDLYYWLFVGKFSLNWLKDDIYVTLHNNEKLIRLTQKTAAEKSTRPRFIYTHLYLPHLPFYFDEHGKLKDPKTIVEDEKSAPVAAYINNLRVANVVMLNLVNTIMSSSNNKAVIVLAGDHGYRARKREESPDPQSVFNNFYGVYTPDRHYVRYKDSLSNINMFPILFNTVFNAGMPLLKDSTIYLSDKR